MGRFASEDGWLRACGLRATMACLLSASLRDLLDDLIVDVSVGYNDSTAAVAEPDGDYRALLVVGDLLGREVTDEDGLTGHASPFDDGWKMYQVEAKPVSMMSGDQSQRARSAAPHPPIPQRVLTPSGT